MAEVLDLSKPYDSAFWGVEPLNKDKRGEAKHTSLYTAVGNALTVWETLEDTMARLFMFLSEPKTAQPANLLKRCFGTIESCGGRLNMIDVAAEIYFGNEFKDKKISGPYNVLREYYQKAQHKRNEIAHGKVSKILVAGTGRTKSYGVLLSAADYLNGRNLGWLDKRDSEDPLGWMTSKYRYNAVDVNKIASRFNDINFAILNYMTSVAKDNNGIPKNVLEMHTRRLTKAEEAKGDKTNAKPRQRGKSPGKGKT